MMTLRSSCAALLALLSACGSATAVLSREEARATHPDCPGAAVVIASGVDADADGALADAEVATSVVVCGSTDACEVDTSETATTVTCPNHPPVVVPSAPNQLGRVRGATAAECLKGGHAMDFGLDADADGTLDAAEVAWTNVLCADKLISHGARVEAHDGCEGGAAAVVVSGLDADADGTLAQGEIGATVVVCESAAACQVEESPTAHTVTCPNHAAVVIAKPAAMLVVRATGGPCVRGGFVISAGNDDGPEGDAGNGLLDDSEVDAQDTLCAPFCGDGVIDALLGETCDDGGTTSFDGCSATCLLEPSCAGEAPPESCFETELRVESFEPATGPTAGGTLVTLVGVFPVPGPDEDTITFGDTTIAATHVSETQVEFRTPAGAGLRELSLRVNGYPIPFVRRTTSASGLVTTELAPAATFAYLRPTITAVAGCNEDVGCALTGGDVLHVTGTNFGPSGAAVSVRVGDEPCLGVVWIDDGELSCTLPARPTGGFELPVVVTVEGQASEPLPVVSYAAPRLLPGTLRLAGGMATASLELPAPGSFDVEFDVTGLTDLPTVTFGIDEAWFECAVDAAASHPIVEGRIRCRTAPLAVGRNLRFRVVDGGVASRPGPDDLSFPAPVLLPNSLRQQVTEEGASMLIGASSSGARVYFDVMNIPFDPTHLRVRLGFAGGPFLSECTGVSLSGGPTLHTLGCDTPLGTGEGLTFVVEALNNPSAPGTDTFNYPPAPVIDSVSGCVDEEPGTSGCPTEGGVRLRLSGSRFDLPGLTIRVNGAVCEALTVLDGQTAECTLPPGVGPGELVAFATRTTLETGILQSVGAPPLTYAAPEVTSVRGTIQDGALVTIRGTNFGPARAAVVVGARSCTEVAHGDDAHRGITCRLPPGAGANVPLRVFSGFASAPFFVSYPE